MRTAGREAWESPTYWPAELLVWNSMLLSLGPCRPHRPQDERAGLGCRTWATRQLQATDVLHHRTRPQCCNSSPQTSRPSLCEAPCSNCMCGCTDSQAFAALPLEAETRNHPPDSSFFVEFPPLLFSLLPPPVTPAKEFRWSSGET